MSHLLSEFHVMARISDFSERVTKFYLTKVMAGPWSPNTMVVMPIRDGNSPDRFEMLPHKCESGYWRRNLTYSLKSALSLEFG